MMKFGIKGSALLPAPMAVPKPVSRLLPISRETDAKLKQEARYNEAESKAVRDAVDNIKIEPRTRLVFRAPVKTPLPQQEPDAAPADEPFGVADVASVEDSSVHRKLTQLVADNFPFDESQLHAVNELVSNRFGCITGAAGTGKTTTLKKLVDSLLESVTTEIDMSTYFKIKKIGDNDDDEPVHDDDDYEVTRKFVPSVCVCTFTGKASQMVKKNFPRDWHGNIMTIHRMLAFAPEYYLDVDKKTGQMVNKRRFMPQYTAEYKLPWDIIIIDEAGMVSLDLWLMVYAAMKQGCRVYMVGDINQLPPIHGRSIFGFALANWPSFELTTIHRQAGVNNAIVDNAWLILKGKTPQFDNARELSWQTPQDLVKSLNWMVTNPDWKAAGFRLPDDPHTAARIIRKALELLHNKWYDPIRDTVITAINGHDGSSGRQLGQIPMNQELSIILNKSADRIIIDAGRDRKLFAEGDKVMATKNDHEQGITNGMTGIIREIKWNEAYTGDRRRWGNTKEVNEWMANGDDGVEDSEDADLDNLDALADAFALQMQGKEDKKEKAERGPASHTVTVHFGDDEHGFEIVFATLSEVESLSMAYVVTCHKMQGGESPHVLTILHTAHKGLALVTREWLYTGWTRASQKAVLLYTDFALRTALNRQSITGATLQEKVAAFNRVQKLNTAYVGRDIIPSAERIAV